MQPDIKKLTLIELQAYAYQNIRNIEALQNGLKQLNDEIALREQLPIVKQPKK